MTPLEAYNKGLNDAEENIIGNFTALLNERTDTPFPNPKLEAVRQVIKDRSEYYYNLASRNNNIGKSFKKKLEEQKEMLANS